VKKAGEIIPILFFTSVLVKNEAVIPLDFDVQYFRISRC
jgi:hypothetical protein